MTQKVCKDSKKSESIQRKKYVKIQRNQKSFYAKSMSRFEEIRKDLTQKVCKDSKKSE